MVRRGVWLRLAGRDSKRAQVEIVARVNPATTIHQRTSSASGLSGLVATTRGALRQRLHDQEQRMNAFYILSSFLRMHFTYFQVIYLTVQLI